MRNYKYIWVLGLVTTLAILIIPMVIFLPKGASRGNDPWDYVPPDPVNTDHSNLLEGPFDSGPAVTLACLECHEQAAHQVSQSVHWTWESDPIQMPGRAEAVTIGKKNQINNFCIGVQGNWPSCTACHAGYGWEDANFDFADQSQVDCLVCHDTTGTYLKGRAGLPVEGVDLLAVAQSVGSPTRENCGSCHFKGGGGNAVKHGDLDESLYFPSEEVDVHMGRYDFQCIDCHQTQDHNIQGRSISVSIENDNQVYCSDCHQDHLHQDGRIDAHLQNLACQSCHIPSGAVEHATKMYWDWSQAGQDLPEDPHTYLKIKGSFIYERDFTPEYYWYNGMADRYLLGDPINPHEVTMINQPLGGIEDPQARIWPFKVHRARQIYDVGNSYLLQPKTVGEGGYWTEFDWDLAARLGAEATGLAYSGEFDFTETEMYWPLAHMVAPADKALQCAACHGENGRMDWQALGYAGDPINQGGRMISSQDY